MKIQKTRKKPFSEDRLYRELPVWRKENVIDKFLLHTSRKGWMVRHLQQGNWKMGTLGGPIQGPKEGLWWSSSGCSQYKDPAIANKVRNKTSQINEVGSSKLRTINSYKYASGWWNQGKNILLVLWKFLRTIFSYSLRVHIESRTNKISSFSSQTLIDHYMY